MYNRLVAARIGFMVVIAGLLMSLPLQVANARGPLDEAEDYVRSVLRDSRASSRGSDASDTPRPATRKTRPSKAAEPKPDREARSKRAPARAERVSSAGNISWNADRGCLNGTLRSVLNDIAQFTGLTVNSTCRDRGHNRSVGGAPHSMHLSGDAVDFRVNGNVSRVISQLRSNGSVGGIKHYGGGLFHIDTGARRSW